MAILRAFLTKTKLFSGTTDLVKVILHSIQKTLTINLILKVFISIQNVW